jgi:hypothetical protein
MQEPYKDEESVYAALGTAAHFVTEWCRNEGKKPEEFLGKSITFPRQDGGGEWAFECDQEMVDATNIFLDYVYSLPCDSAYVEQLLHYGAWVDSEAYGPGFGTVDDTRIDEAQATCYVTDYKYGKGVVVVAEDNWQLWIYCLAVYYTYGHLYEIEKFVIAIVQPRNGGVTTAELDLETLLTWADTFVKPRATEAADPNEGRYAPSEDACRWCLARHRCRARAAWVFNQVDPDYAHLSNNELAIIHPHLAGMRKALDDYEAQISRELEEGHQVGDLKRVPGRAGNRSWADEEAAIKALTSRAKTGGKLKKDQVYKPGKLISPTDAEKLLGKDHPIITRTEKEGDIVRKLNSEFIVQPNTKPVIVGGDDPRDAIDIDASNEFENVE